MMISSMQPYQVYKRVCSQEHFHKKKKKYLRTFALKAALQAVQLLEYPR